MLSKAKKIISAILDKGLADSTWRENFPRAYESLLGYRADMEASTAKVLRGKKRKSTP